MYLLNPDNPSIVADYKVHLPLEEKSNYKNLVAQIWNNNSYNSITEASGLSGDFEELKVNPETKEFTWLHNLARKELWKNGPLANTVSKTNFTCKAPFTLAFIGKNAPEEWLENCDYLVSKCISILKRTIDTQNLETLFQHIDAPTFYSICKKLEKDPTTLFQFLCFYHYDIFMFKKAFSSAILEKTENIVSIDSFQTRDIKRANTISEDQTETIIEQAQINSVIVKKLNLKPKRIQN